MKLETWASVVVVTHMLTYFHEKNADLDNKRADKDIALNQLPLLML